MADRPIYSSAFIQDKFSFKDIIFRIGVRVDRFDANRKVLKDPYSLYEIQGARDFYATTGGEQPAGVGDDFKVYLQSAGSNIVKAFRDGEDWYFANGNPANDGRPEHHAKRAVISIRIGNLVAHGAIADF